MILHALMFLAIVIDDRWPHFSPDGRNIAFTSTRNGAMQAFVMNSDGKNQHLVSSAAPGRRKSMQRRSSAQPRMEAIDRSFSRASTCNGRRFLPPET